MSDGFVAVGNLDAADAFLATVPPGSTSHRTSADQAEALKDQLEAYNAD